MSGEKAASKATPLLDLEFDGGALYALRSTVAAHALEAGLGDGWVNDLVGAAHELAANAVVHGGGRGRLRLWKEHEALHVQVSDSGSGSEGDPAGWGDTEGSGLWMVRRMVDQMDLRAGPYGTIVTVSLAITDASRLRIDASDLEGWRILTLVGDLDLRTVPDLAAAISQAAGGTGGASRLVLDLAEVAFIDSSGFAALIGARQTLEALPSGALVLAAPSERLTRRLRTLGLYDRFRIRLTVAEAVSIRLYGYPAYRGLFLVTEMTNGWPPRDVFEHPLMLGHGDEAFTEQALGFVAEGLSRGEQVAAAVPETRLGVLAAEFGPSLRLFDLTNNGRNPGRILPLVLLAFAESAPEQPIRILQESVWAGRSELEYPACVQHEALTNLAFAGHAAAGQRVTVGCFYDTGALGPSVVDDAHTTHPGSGYSEAASLALYDIPLPEPDVLPDVLRFDSASQELTRTLASRSAAAADFSVDRAIDVELVVNELTANSVNHGGGSGGLRIWTEKQALVCEVTDRGRITDPLAGRRPAGLSVTGGRGLLLVNCLADLVRVHTTEDSLTIRAYFTR